MADNEDSLPRLLGRRYRLEAKLGSGGMGVVYRATDLTMHRPVAIKLVGGADGGPLDEEVAGRFLREAKNTARVQHENIIEVYDLGRSAEGDMFFVMELLEGQSLASRLRQAGKLSVASSVHIGRQICAALNVAHAAGVIHRDLKPGNVMLLKRAGRDDYVKVLDFGVAKSYSADQETQLTHTGMLVGTIEYMAPEQIMGRTVDGRTDIYSLGILLYRMLTGKPPFRDAGAQALIHAHLNLFPKPMTELDRALPGVLDRVVLRCLAKQPEQRYETMAEVSRALDAALEPTELGLAYESQPYTDGDATAVGPRGAPPTGAPSPYDDAPWAEDSTTKVARGRTRPAAAPPSGPTEPMPPVPGAPPSVNDFGARDETAVMSRQDAEALRVAGLERAAARECAMCKTLNPPHARACGACGVSLDHEDQAAVRARVTAPRTAHLLAPQMPPPSASAFAPPHGPTGPLEAQAPHGAPGPALQGSQVAPWHGAPQGGGPAPRGPQGSLPGVPFPPGVPYTGSGPRGWGTPPSNPPPAGRPTAWQRFLAWTGLRGR